MDLKSSESGVPQSSFLDLSDIKPGVVFQLNQTGTFFFLKTMNDTFTEASSGPQNLSSSPAFCEGYTHRRLRPSTYSYSLGRCSRWSDCSPITWAPTKQPMFYFWFPKKAEQGIFGFPCTDWCFPEGMVRSVFCVFGGAGLAVAWRV